MSEKKGRLLFLEHYLLENTDEAHPVTTGQLRRVLEENGYSVSRNTLPEDILLLQNAGVDVIAEKAGRS